MLYTHQHRGRGYMLLLLLLIGTALGLFLTFGRGMLKTGDTKTDELQDSQVHIELQSIQQAQNVKNMVEQNSRNAAEVK